MEKTRASINGKKGIFGCGGASFGVVEEQEFLDEISQVIDQFTEASLLALVHVDKFLSNFEGVPPPWAVWFKSSHAESSDFQKD